MLTLFASFRYEISPILDFRFITPEQAAAEAEKRLVLCSLSQVRSIIAKFGLKNMCSYRCERPCSSGGSVNEPLRTASSTVTIGTDESCSTITSSPFGRVLFTNGTA